MSIKHRVEQLEENANGFDEGSSLANYSEEEQELLRMFGMYRNPCRFNRVDADRFLQWVKELPGDKTEEVSTKGEKGK